MMMILCYYLGDVMDNIPHYYTLIFKFLLMIWDVTQMIMPLSVTGGVLEMKLLTPLTLNICKNSQKFK